MVTSSRRACNERCLTQLHRVDGWQFINPDLTISLHRHPVGEWVCLEAETVVQPHGIGLAESRLWDRDGRALAVRCRAC
jgi:acyl-CoA thioesterase